MRFRDFLTEAFDKAYPWEVIDKNPGRRWTLQFDTDKKDKEDLQSSVRVNIMYDKFAENWEVDFDRNGSHDKTGTGDQYRIFATILQILEKFVKDESPEKVIFSASKGVTGESRTKLYEAMCKKLASKHDYEFEVIRTRGADHFELTRA